MEEKKSRNLKFKKIQKHSFFHSQTNDSVYENLEDYNPKKESLNSV